MTAEFDLGTVATYSCNDGYQLITGPGGDIRICVDGGDGNGGVFDGEAPICERKADLLTIKLVCLSYCSFLLCSNIISLFNSCM